MNVHELDQWFFDEFGACGCGMPEEVAALLLKVLEQFERRGFGATQEEGFAAYEALKNLLPDDGVRYFVFYRLSALNLEEHGGSSPGWLTEKGYDVLAALRAFGTDPGEWGDHCSASSNGRCPCGVEVPNV